MPSSTMSYWHLPMPVRDAIERDIGPVHSAPPAGAAGLVAATSQPVAALAATSHGRFFIKALPDDDDQAGARQQREVDLANHVRPIAATLIAHLTTAGWNVLIFDGIDGTQADYRPSSADLSSVGSLLTELAGLACPDVELAEAPLLWQKYAGDSDLHLFAGHTLLHTRPDPDHVIITGGQARLVGWGSAARGAAWLDPACWVLQLIAAGHDPLSAETIAEAAPAWRTAPASAVNAFTAAAARRWKPTARRTDPSAERLAAAVRRWRRYRRSGISEPAAS
jgi:hypothetical protein